VSLAATVILMIYGFISLQCDLLRPQCGQCLRGGFECGGFHRDIVFIQYDPSTSASRSGAKSAQQATTRPRQDGTAVIAMRSRAASSFEPLSQTLGRSAFETKAYELFWNEFLPKAGLPLRGNTIVAADKWAKAVQQISPSSDVLRLAFSSHLMSTLISIS
jgi:hypothetical protein